LDLLNVVSSICFEYLLKSIGYFYVLGYQQYENQYNDYKFLFGFVNNNLQTSTSETLTGTWINWAGTYVKGGAQII
jgi:hypothetical protein